MPDRLRHGMERLGLQRAWGKLVDGPGQRGSGGEVPRFMVGDSDRSAYQVSVAVDKAGHDYAAGGVDEGGLARECEILEPPAGSDIVDTPVDDQNGAVLNEAEIPEVGPAPGTASSAQREELPGAPDQCGLRHRMGVYAG